MVQVRKVVVGETTPGVVHITTEALHDLLTSAGWMLDANSKGDTRTYVRLFNDARPAHPDTQIGRLNR